MERFFKSFKNEWMPLIGCRVSFEAKLLVSNLITDDYSRVRPHQHNVGLSPSVAEKKYRHDHKPVANIT